MTPEDAPDLLRWTADPEVTRYVTWDAHRSLEEARAFLEERLRRGDGFSWGLVPREGTGGVVGLFRYVRWAPEHARADLAYVLARSHWGRGLATGAVREIIRFGFENMALNRVEARCAAENVASARVMQRAGMSHEATLRGREFWKGRFWDMQVYSVLRDEWQDAHPPRRA